MGNLQDVRLDTEDQIGRGSLRQKAQENLRAIRILQALDEEGRDPTPEEKRALARFVGWGAFGQAFHPKFTQFRRGEYHVGYEVVGGSYRQKTLQEYEQIPEYTRRRWSQADKAHWELNQEIRDVMTPEEYEAASKSILNAHFTSPAVVQAMWAMVEKLGFRGGRVLEPAMGSGNFFGFQPEHLAQTSRRTGVELDRVTGKIATHLYPNADVKVQGFEETPLPNDYFDLAISNVPFGNFGVHDPEYQRSGRNWLTKSIHNYFFAKSLEKVRPGGLVAFITSHHTLDAPTHKRFREHLAEQADLVAAIRLPNDAFQENAGTRVTTDILILRKKDPQDPEFEALHPRDERGRFIRKWTDTREVLVKDANGDEHAVTLNEYFADHPEAMLGTLGVGSGFGQMPGETGVRSDGREMEAALQSVLAGLPAEVMSNGTDYRAAQEAEEAAKRAPDALKPGAYHVEGGEVYRNVREGLNAPGKLVVVEGGEALKARLAGMIGLRQAALRLIAAHYEDMPEEELAGLRADLGALYDAFVAEHGLLHERANMRAFASDPDAGLLLALEKKGAAQGQWEKADLFTRRTITPVARAVSAKGPEDALGIVLNERGQIDWKRLSALLARDPEEIRDALAASGLIFRDPTHLSDPVTHGWVTADEYLSGPVRQKLREAEAAAATDKAFAANVDALRQVQPEDLTPAEITGRLGAAWIPQEYVEQFWHSLVGAPPEKYGRSEYDPDSGQYAPKKREQGPEVSYNRGTGEWTVETLDTDRRRGFANTQEWGTQRRSARDVLLACLRLQDITVSDKDPDTGKSIFNAEETFAAREKQQKMRDRFEQWLWEDPERAHHCVRLYNDLFNDSRMREFDGAHLTTPGMASHVGGEHLRAHIRNAVWRAVTEGSALFDHCTGSGKTRTMAITAMELRRLGLAKKPMITVPNHMIAQWDADFREFYPGAKILTVWAKEWTPEKRKEFTAQIATGDWDAILITHSAFGQIPISEGIVQKYYGDQIRELEDVISETSDETTAKQLMKRLESLEKKLKDKIALVKKGQDNCLPFDALGVDALFVDEADMFKNLFFASRMTRVSGLGGSESGRAMDLFMKSQWMLQKNNQRGLYFGTATPISNSMAEMYTMMRYLDMPGLRQKGMARFDEWASSFGQTVTTVEAAPEGGYRSKTRFSRFVNVPEMVKLYRQFADVKLIQDLPYLPIPDKEDRHYAAPASQALQEVMEEIKERAQEIRARRAEPTEDNMLKLSSDARKASLDVRLIRPDAPDDPRSKVNQCVRNVVSIYKDPEASSRQATQIVFLDLGTPKGASDKEDAPQDGETAEEQALSISIYEDMRRKMVAAGIPREEIAFAHEFDTDQKKAQLREMMNGGKLRVLIGSTEKAGSGLNVQERLFALHHLDCPWRPRDLEQREGRIIRQGNKHKDWDIPVQIHRYVTEGSFDEYMWQTVLAKAGFIGQVRSGSSGARQMEDVDAVQLTAAEMIAHASGDPVVHEKVKVESEILRLSALRAAHQTNRWRGQERARKLLAENQKIEEQIATMRETRQVYEKHKPDGFAMTVGGSHFTERQEGIVALKRALTQVSADRGLGKLDREKAQPIASYAGFDLLAGQSGDQPMLLVQTPSGREVLRLIGEGMEASAESIMGIIQYRLRISESQIGEKETRHKANAATISNLQADMARPFEREAEFERLTARKEEIDALLDKNRSEDGGEEPLVKSLRVVLFKSYREPIGRGHVGALSDTDHALHIRHHEREFRDLRRSLHKCAEPRQRRQITAKLRVLAAHRAQHLLARHGGRA